MVRSPKPDRSKVQEIRWLGYGILEKRNYSFYYSCHDSQHQFGTGFVVSKKLRERVVDFVPVSERICKLRLRGKLHNISIICVHAPTEEKPEVEKDGFYDRLENVFSGCHSNDIKMVVGDFNAKAGKDHSLKEFIGNNNLHDDFNDNGTRLEDFASANDQVVGGTIFPHKNVHKHTWRSPDGLTFNQIYHILIDKRHRSSLIDVRSYRGANVDSDHFLVLSKVRAKISRLFTRRERKEVKKLDYNELKKPETLKRYRNCLKESFTSRDYVENERRQWKDVVTVINNAANVTIPELKKNKRENGWYDEECEELTNRKNQAYRVMIGRHSTRNSAELYKELGREEKRMHKKKKRIFMENKYGGENMETQREARKFYQLVNDIRKDFNSRTTTSRKRNGELTCNNTETMIRWREHFKEVLFGNDSPVDEAVTFEVPSTLRQTQNMPVPTLRELEYTLKNLNRNRAPGPYGIKAELLIVNAPELNNELLKIISDVWNQEQMPIEWEGSSIFTIHKKGDRLDCRNYRGITLLNVAFKIFSNILFRRLLPYVLKVVGNYQCGFLEGKSTIDQIHSIRQILEKTKEYGIDTYHLFIDFKAAYDCINRNKLFEAMYEFGIPPKLINLVKMTLGSVKCRIKTMSEVSEVLYTERGLRQGDSLSCILFNLALEKVIRDSSINTRATILQRTIQILAYVDDIDIVGRRKQDVIEAFVALENAAKELGLTVNEEKTKFSVASTRIQDVQPLNIRNYTFEGVTQFKCLGALITKFIFSARGLYKRTSGLELPHEFQMKEATQLHIHRGLREKCLMSGHRGKRYNTREGTNSQDTGGNKTHDLRLSRRSFYYGSQMQLI
ncbi:uncharacterized protein LOC129228537 [Uloborus diversus]|uniref:uncharacterized protein LOC129228537 n=1 Tax=Uloborus diversus TaxID=327109 RepID=UPI002409FF31|nr:uncharacterized protein LOC129228537 [Uloborus diversus]